MRVQKMVIVVTLVEIIDGDRLLLKKASRGISKNKWNGLGGKVEAGETPLECAVREAFEESGLLIKNPFYHGVINFHDFGSDSITWEGHVFSARQYSGQLKETEEGELRWFDIEKLPCENMWKGDMLWLPLLSNNKKFYADIYFDKDNRGVLKHNIEVKD